MSDFTGKTDKQIVDIIQKDKSWMVSDRQCYEPLWDILIKIFQPRRVELLMRTMKKGQRYGARVYDGHPANAANKFALGMLAHQMSRTQPWIQFLTSDVRLMKDDNVKKYVQGAAEQILFGLGQSDVYGQSVWFMKDSTVIGTGAMIPEENRKDGKMHFGTVHPKDSYIKYDRFGNLMTYQRPVVMSAIEAFDEFDEKKLSKQLVKDAKGLNPFKQYRFIYATYRNPNHTARLIQNDADDTGSVRSEDKKFRVFYVQVDAANSKKSRLVLDSGTRFEPIIWPYGRETDTNYGVSLAADALTEGLQSNKLGELMLTMVHREADPPTEAWKGLKDAGLQTRPGGRNWIPEKFAASGAQAIRQIFDNGNWPISDAQIDRLGATLDDKFFVPLWDALLTLQGPQRTLGEVLQIQGNKAILLSPVSVDFEEMFLKKVVDNQWIFEEQIARRMPDVPDILLDPKNRGIETVFIGPLPQLQRATMQTRGTVNALAIIERIGTIWPNSLVKINEMELMEEAAIAQGLKQTFIKTDEEVQDIIEAQQAKADAEIQTQQMIEAAKTVPGLGKEVEAGSPLAAIGEAAA